MVTFEKDSLPSHGFTGQVQLHTLGDLPMNYSTRELITRQGICISLFKPCDRGGRSYKHALSPVIEVGQSYKHALSSCVAKV